MHDIFLGYYKFSMDGVIAASGNIRSLLDKNVKERMFQNIATATCSVDAQP